MSKQRVIARAAIAALLSSYGSGALAADNHWTGAAGDRDWNTAANWEFNRVPIFVNDNDFDDGVVNTTTGFPIITKDFSATPRDIVVGTDAGSVGRIDHTAGTARTGGGNWMFVGRNNGTGTYNLANTAAAGGTLTGYGQGSGSINIGGRLYVGGTDVGALSSPGSFGTLNVNTSGAINVGNDLTVGSTGSTGVLNLDAGTITTGGWNFIGKPDLAPGANGTLNISGGTINNTGGRTYVGLGATTGLIKMTGGAYNNPGDRFVVGENNAGPDTAQIILSGGTLTTNLLTVGGQPDQPGQGRVTVNAAAAALNAGELWVGQRGTSNGFLDVSAGKVSVNSWIAVGRESATGTINLSGGTIEHTGGNTSHIIIGSLSGTGTVTQSGGTFRTVGGGDILLGEGAGGGTWNVSGGTASADTLKAGWNGLGVVAVSGGAALTFGNVRTSENGQGTVNQSGGTVNVANVLTVQAGAQLGTYALSGGTLSVDGAIDATKGAFTFTGGRITRSNGGVITYTGNLTTGTKDAGFKLDNNKTFAISGLFNNTAGETFDVTGDVIPANPGGAPLTGLIKLGNVGSISSEFDPATTTLIGLTNTPNATFIPEFQGELGLFDAAKQSVFWVQENAGQVSLAYSVAPVPEPTAVGVLMLSGIGFLSRRRRRAE